MLLRLMTLMDINRVSTAEVAGPAGVTVGSGVAVVIAGVGVTSDLPVLPVHPADRQIQLKHKSVKASTILFFIMVIASFQFS